MTEKKDICPNCGMLAELVELLPEGYLLCDVCADAYEPDPYDPRTFGEDDEKPDDKT